jgi:hypothetical protein
MCTLIYKLLAVSLSVFAPEGLDNCQVHGTTRCIESYDCLRMGECMHLSFGIVPDLQHSFLSCRSTLTSWFRPTMLLANRRDASNAEETMLKDVIPAQNKIWWRYPGLRSLNLLLLCAIVTDITNGKHLKSPLPPYSPLLMLTV